MSRKFFALFTLVVFLGAGCGGPSSAQIAATTPVTLKIWRVFDPHQNFAPLESAYQKIHPNVSFEYKEFDARSFKQELLRALAEGTGPDIFSLNNAWLGEYKSLIEPMLLSTKIPYSETRGKIKKETIYTLKEQPSLSLRALRTSYVDVVANDVIQSYRPNTQTKPVDRVFGLPLAVDTLVLFYNNDLLNESGFPESAKTWSEFQTQISKLTRLGDNNSIIQSGAAIGTSKNVERSTDILSLLMMQNGTQMADDRGLATFARPSTEKSTILGLNAARFYTDFANPTKQVYTWNKDEPNSFDAFTAGKTAYFFGYSYHIPLIRAAAPKLKFHIAPVPQIEGGKAVNFANYWIETVSKASKNKDFAWDFIQFAASADRVPLYLNAAKKPTALRALIGTQMDDEDLSVFASQLLTAKSWYKGTDTVVAENALQTFIDQVLAGEDAEDAIRAAENKVNQTL
ncbi:MAG: extracellular solute-binding protein [Patescibacteria group bacterium]